MLQRWTDWTVMDGNAQTRTAMDANECQWMAMPWHAMPYHGTPWQVVDGAGRRWAAICDIERQCLFAEKQTRTNLWVITPNIGLLWAML